MARYTEVYLGSQICSEGATYIPPSIERETFVNTHTLPLGEIITEFSYNERKTPSETDTWAGLDERQSLAF